MTIDCGRFSPNKLRGKSTTPAASEMEFFVTLVKPLTTVTRRSIVDIAGVLDMPLKLVTIKTLKISYYKIMSTATKI